MKPFITKTALCCLVLLSCALASANMVRQGQSLSYSGFLSVANSASFPANLPTGGSCLAVPVDSSHGSVTFSVNLNYTGQIHLYETTGAGKTQGGTLRVDQVPADASSTIVAANTNGTFTCAVTPGTVFIVATSLSANEPYIVAWQGPALASFSGTIGSVTANAGTNLNTSALALETGGNLASAVTKLTSILAALPSSLVSGGLVTNGATTLNTFSTGGEASNSVTTSAAVLTLSGGGDPATPLFVIVTNTGTANAWVSPFSGGHTFLCPANSTVYVPASNTTLYGIGAASTTLICVKAAH